jgi:hypothetical protein
MTDEHCGKVIFNEFLLQLKVLVLRHDKADSYFSY